MESLYTKYRPQTFADVVGQTHVVTTLQHAVIEGRTSHAYLFCGPRGTGKTTMARLLAKALMCDQGEGHLPDGTCEQCRLIAAGEHPDVYELDAASRTGVDNVREEIISRVNFAPVRGRYKLYIIDEVHMLTTAAFNALLKTLEEPPAHVVFVLCTTDPQKIPETILSRVQRFDFHAISNADIQGRLAYICEREGFSYDPEALELVVRHARGGMRDAISELEQLSVSGGGTISVDVARDVLGEVSSSTLEKMSLAMANRDVPTLFAQVEGLVEVGRDLLQFTRALAARLRDVYVVAAIGAKSPSITAAETDLPAISREAQAFGSVDRVGRALQLLSDASTEMRVAPNQRLVLEVALTKIARPQTELTLEALADRVASLERQVAALSAPGARREAAPAPARPAQPAVAAPAADASARDERPAAVREQPAVAQAPQEAHAAERPAPAPAPANPQPQPAAATVAAPAAPMQPAAPVAAAPQPKPATPAPVRQSAQPAAPAPAPTPAPAAAPAPAPAPMPARTAAPTPTPASAPAPAGSTPAIVDAGELQRRWRQVVDSLQATHPQHGSLLLNATLASDDGERLLVSLPKGSGFACRMLDRPDVRSHVDPVIAQVFGPRKTHFAEADVVATMAARGVPTTPAPAVQPTQRPAAPAQPQHAAPAQPQQAVPAQAARQPQQQAPQVQAPQAVPAAPRQTAATPSQTPQAPSWQAPAQQTPKQARPQVPAQQPAAQQNPLQQPVGQKAQAAPAYPAPWEPLPADDDQVPYGDLDAAPYEEDYLFGTVDDNPYGMPRAQAQPATQPQQVVRPPQPQQVPVAQAPAAPAAPAPAPEPPVPIVQSQPAPEPPVVPAQPQQDSVASAPAPQPEPAPAVPTEPAPDPASAPAPVAEEPAPAPKRTRTRQVGGIPTDLVTMLSEVFGEGITFTELPPDDPAEDEDADSALAEQEADGENEYADEPVDDADYEDEE